MPILCYVLFKNVNPMLCRLDYLAMNDGPKLLYSLICLLNYMTSRHCILRSSLLCGMLERERERERLRKPIHKMCQFFNIQSKDSLSKKECVTNQKNWFGLVLNQIWNNPAIVLCVFCLKPSWNYFWFCQICSLKKEYRI